MASSGQAGRLQSVLIGRRQVGQQSLELILAGYEDLEGAEQAVRKQLPALVRTENRSSGNAVVPPAGS